MKPTPITQNVKSLDFSPRKEVFPRDLAWIIDGYQLSGFGAENGLEYTGDLGDFFEALYPNLGVGEWARLYRCVQTVEPKKFKPLWEKLTATKPQLREKPSLMILEVLGQLPKDFQDWCDEKGVSLKELHPLKLWHINGKPHRELLPLVEKILNFRCSRREGVTALEESIDLYLMGDNSAFLLAVSSKKEWLKETHRHRFPKASRQDLDSSTRVSSAPWPKNVHAKYIRQGDDTGVEIKFTISSPTDLESFICNLGEKKEDLCRHLWKNS